MKPKIKIIKHSNFFGDGYGLLLTIGCQSFKLDCVSETKEEAKWHREQLKTALSNLFSVSK